MFRYFDFLVYNYKACLVSYVCSETFFDDLPSAVPHLEMLLDNSLACDQAFFSHGGVRKEKNTYFY